MKVKPIIVPVKKKYLESLVANKTIQAFNEGDKLLAIKYHYINGGNIDPQLISKATHVQIEETGEVIELDTKFKAKKAWLLRPIQ